MLKYYWTVKGAIASKPISNSIPRKHQNGLFTRHVGARKVTLFLLTSDYKEPPSEQNHEVLHGYRTMAENPISRARAAALSVILLLCLSGTLNLVPVTEAIWLEIPTTGTKCVSEEIQKNVVVLADYYAFDLANPEHLHTISARVTSPFGNNLHHNENVTHGQFAFTTSEAGNYLACFWLSNSQQQGAGTTLSLDWRMGIATKDWDSIAKKDKLGGLELELSKLESVVQSVHSNLIYLKNREAEMREVSEATNARVAWFSIMSLSVCIIVSVLQLMHLKRYFHKKKLI